MELVFSITKDIQLSYEERNERAHQLISAFFNAENPDFEKHIERVGNSLLKQTTHADYYRPLFENSIKLQRLLGALIKSMHFDPQSKDQDMMFEIDRHTQFSQCFRNRLPLAGKSDVDIRLLFATILSLGTNLGHTELARASKVFSEKALKDTENTWVSIANLQRANDCLVKTIQSLSLPTIFNENNGRLHSRSDGKKVVVNVNSLLANYSYKYYGKEQRISVNSFLDEKQSFFHVNVLTSSYREAPYVLEGLVSSKHTLIDDDIVEHFHSTDTHGYTEAVFAGLHFMDVSFAPRIKNVHHQTLYAFTSKSTRKHFDSPLAPKSQINKKLILNNWDDILRLMASMKLKRCSASQMLKMLSSSERDNALYKAFKEFGRLLKTHFILSYVDGEELRQNIQK